jgi:threonine aldolase
MIDLRSDTATKPTPEMRDAIAKAEVGDEQLREDPTVNELERRAADTLAQEDSVFVPTATMANEIALRVLGEPGDELIAEENAHILTAELGGPAVHAGLMTRPLPAEAGRFTTDQVRAAARRGDLGHVPTTRIVAIENTHNSSGGRVWPLPEIAAMAETCRELELCLHIDGARLFNAAVASGEAPSAIAGHGDTVTICFSKGLGCPLGAIVAGSAERMLRARRFKHQFGGAMRQAGIVAAACVYALDHHVERLADDHARARRLAEGLHEAGVPVDLEQVETNFVQIYVGSLGFEIGDAIERLLGEGIRVSGTMLPGVLRAVTHLGITDEDIELAIEAILRGLGVQRSPARKNASAAST